MHDGGRKAVLAALLANTSIAIAKFIGFAITGAASMLAEAIHSCADAGNQALLFLGGAKAKKAPTETHPFGYGRERYFWAFVVAIVLFSVGSLFALYEGVEKLRHGGHDLERAEVAIGILIFAIVAEILSFRTAIIEAQKIRNGQGWWTFIRRTKNPEITVVLLEDAGALIGLVLALVGVSLALVTHNAAWDAMGSLSIGVLLGVIAYVLAKETKSFLIGESADVDEVERIRVAIESAPTAQRMIHMRTLQLGPDDMLVTAKVEFVPDLDQAALSDAINDVEHRIRQTAPTAGLIFIEPDIYREDIARPETNRAH